MNGKRLERAKQPYFIRLKGGQPFAFAGLWEHWEGEGQVIESCTLIVTEANALMKAIHDRMPVILPRDTYAAWMDPTEQDPEPLLKLLRLYSEAGMEAYPVSTQVNSPRNNRRELMVRAQPN